MMHEQEKSDPCTVAKKPVNKLGQPGAESVERRRGAEGNTGEPHTCRTQCRDSVPQGLARVRQDALPSITRGGSRVRKLRPLGSVRGVPGNRHSYRDKRSQFSRICVDKSLPDAAYVPVCVSVKVHFRGALIEQA